MQQTAAVCDPRIEEVVTLLNELQGTWTLSTFLPAGANITIHLQCPETGTVAIGPRPSKNDPEQGEWVVLR